MPGQRSDQPPLPANRLDELRFELWPAPLEQLQRQHWKQQSIDPCLQRLRCCCRRLVVQAPGCITLRCACPRCAAAAEAEDPEMLPDGAPEWQPPPDDTAAWLAEALGWQAAQLAAPGSLLRRVELRSQLARLEPDGDPEDAAGQSGAVCGRRQGCWPACVGSWCRHSR